MLMWCCRLRRAGRDKDWRCVLFSGSSVRKGAWHETSYSLFLYDIVYFQADGKVDDILHDDKLDAVICVAGGWAGGNAASKRNHLLLIM